MSPPVHENGPVKELIRVPRPSALNEQLKQRINQIRQKAMNAGVTFTKMGKWEPNGCDFELEGPVESVMEAKTQIAELTLETLGDNSSADERPDSHQSSPKAGNGSADERSPSTKWVSEQIVVPEALVRKVIGAGGERVKAMKEEFGIKMKFLGNNYDRYPNGRPLNLYGEELRVQQAKQYIQQRFLERRHVREQQRGNPENGEQNSLDVSKESSNAVVREHFNGELDSDFEADEEDGQKGEDALDEQENLVDSSQEDGDDVEEEENEDNIIIEAIEDDHQAMEEELIQHIQHTNSELLKRVRQYAEHIHKREAEFKEHENALMKRLKKMELKNARLEAKLEQFKGANAVNGNGKGRVRFNGV